MIKLTDIEADGIRQLQRHLSSIISFDHDNQLVDIFPRYNGFKSPNFICNANRGSLNIRCNRDIMEHICNYFDISFVPIVEMMTTVAKYFDEYKLITYSSYEKSLTTFPNVDEMCIPVDITPLNFYDVKKGLIRAADIKMRSKIFVSTSFEFKDTPTLLINIDFLVSFNSVVRVEISKPLYGEQVFRVSTITSLDSIGRNRKNYKVVNEDQLLRHLKRYAFRRIRVVLTKLLNMENDVFVQDKNNLQQYISLAEMSLI